MSQLRLQGFDTLVLQWTCYGDAFTCSQNSALLFKRAAAAQQAGLKLIVGLNADPEFCAPETAVRGAGKLAHRLLADPSKPTMERRAWRNAAGWLRASARKLTTESRSEAPVNLC